MSTDTKIPLKCTYCSYSWSYSGRLLKATCPSCGNRVHTERDRVEADA